jgi:hypothetical protein
VLYYRVVNVLQTEAGPAGLAVSALQYGIH